MNEWHRGTQVICSILFNTREVKDNCMESLIPFALCHISGFTQTLNVEQLIQTGTSLQQIETSLKSNCVSHYYHKKANYDQLSNV